MAIWSRTQFEPSLVSGPLLCPTAALTEDRSRPAVPVATVRAQPGRLEALMGAHFGLVWRTLRRLGLGSADADDAAQEVFLVVARRLPEVSQGSERAFLLSTARRVASTGRRSLRRRREDAVDALEGEASSELDPEELSSLRQARQLLDRILDEMSDDERIVFVLYELERLSGPEIAELLELPVGTVSTRLRRARALFHERAAVLGKAPEARSES